MMMVEAEEGRRAEFISISDSAGYCRHPLRELL